MLLTIAITVAWAVWFAFLVWYSIRAKWWKIELGRNIFGVSLILMVILLRLAVIRWFPEHAQHDFWGVIIYSIAAALGVQRIRFVERAQREIAHDKELGYTRRKTDI